MREHALPTNHMKVKIKYGNCVTHIDIETFSLLEQILSDFLKRCARKFIHDKRLDTSNSIKFIHVSKDGVSVSSSDNCEDSSAFLAEGTSAITLETISVKIFAL